MAVQTMPVAEINGTRYDLFDQGTGDPVVFIHGAGSFECHAVLQEPALADRFRLVHYHRRGYGSSDPRSGPTSIELEAEDCRVVLEHLGIQRAHFAAESSGGVVLLQYVLDYPETVQSLALLEPALPDALNRSAEFRAAEKLIGETASRGQYDEAAHLFYTEVIGPEYRMLMDPNLPTGWMEQLASEMEAIAKESDALDQWHFGDKDVARIDMPVLNILSSNARPYMADAHHMVSRLIPSAENVVVPDSWHCLLEGRPAESAELLADFFSRHPIRQ